jgi:NADH-quinone oxidoreductase subunit F
MKIAIGQGSCGIASGSKKIEEAFRRHVAENNLQAEVTITGCIGSCYLEPIVDIYQDGGQMVRYVHMTEDKVDKVVRQHLMGHEPVEEYRISKSGTDFLEKQTRIALKNCGLINPEDIRDYIKVGGYKALKKAIFEMDGKTICQEVEKSGLRGRGGGGFPTGKKWGLVAAQTDPIKYVVCNADEGDPGAFMDRSVMEGDPHKMLEGMIIAGIAIGAQIGYIYVRAEYPLAVKRLKKAISQAEEWGFLGKNILGSKFSFEIRINLGAGAFVCGEGSALTASIEGNRGMPRVKPPRTVEQGLFGKPTILNNVETFSHIPFIIANGAQIYRGIGIYKSPGTKAFALTGNVNKTGLVEVPMGTSLREVIFDIGGGIKNNKAFKAVQIGGPSGGCLTEKYLDLSLDFDSLSKVGAMVGSGGLVVMDEETCMVSIAKFFMDFTEQESCGKCVPCREGTHLMNEILDDIVNGRGTKEQIDMLMELADTITTTSLCGLGKTAALPVMSTIREFQDEYYAHVVEKRCPTGKCKGLKRIEIIVGKCKGCGLCLDACPVNAISGKRRQPHVIDKSSCTKCKLCIDSCKFDAIVEI